MKAFAVQYKDKDGFTHFVPYEPMPIFCDINKAQKCLEDETSKYEAMLRGKPIYEDVKICGIFVKTRLIGFDTPSSIETTYYRRLINTMHIGTINVSPQAKIC